MKILNFMMAAILVILCSCSIDRDELVRIVPVGYVVSASETETSWNDHSARMVIVTTDGVFVVKGVFSVIIGDAAYIQEYEDGSRFLCFDSKDHCRRIFW